MQGVAAWRPLSRLLRRERYSSSCCRIARISRTDNVYLMPLDSIEIKSFKSIVSQELEFGRVNVFIGPNGSGKSNLLEAIGVLSSALTGSINYATLAGRGIRLSTPEVFKASFHGIDREDTFSLDAHIDNVRYAVSINPESEARFGYTGEVIESPKGKITKGSIRNTLRTFFEKTSPEEISAGDFEALERFLSSDYGVAPIAKGILRREAQGIDALTDYAIYSPSTPILRGISSDSSHKEPLGLYGGGLGVALQGIMQNNSGSETKIRDFLQHLNWFKSVDTTSEISTELQSSHIHTTNPVVVYDDEFMKTEFNRLYAYDVSEGALYILFVLVLLLHKDAPDIFALDNVDSVLNPTLVRDLMQHLTEAVADNDKKQLFMTTHHPTSLDSVDLFNDDHRLFVVERNERGHTKVRKITPPSGSTKEEWVEKYEGMRLSEIWLEGLLRSPEGGL